MIKLLKKLFKQTPRKAYKATYNFKCLNQTYQVGKTYTSDKLEICKHGFHYCKKMKDVLDYYEPTKDFVLLEIEVLGRVKSYDNKSVTNKMKVLRVIPRDEWCDEIIKGSDRYEYDERGNMISETDSYGDKWTYEYDGRGNMISRTNSSGNKWTYEYDEKGNKISMTDSYGDNWTFEYDKKGNMIYATDSDGDKMTFEYDEKGNKISETSSFTGSKVTIFKTDVIPTNITEED